MQTDADAGPAGRISWSAACAEPFRLLFPAATVAGALGALMWPLHLAGWLAWYPGAGHARIMAQGFFGGFIAGFLGTALPRVLGVKPFRPWETAPLVVLHAAMVACWFIGKVPAGDVLFLLLLGWLAVALARRLPARQDVPPPGFLLVPLGLGCAAAGTVIALVLDPDAPSPALARWQHLLSYQGFLLLPAAGIAPFLLPRFFNQPQREDFPESRRPPPGWWPAAGRAAAVGALVLLSFAVEAGGRPRTGAALRAAVLGLWLAREVPWGKARVPGAVAGVLRLALALIPTGPLLVAASPIQPVAWLHVTLMGGLGLLTLTVASRVVLGHSGQLARLHGHNRWFWGVAAIVIVAVATRVSGDLWPKIQTTHYIYAALLWAGALAWWGWRILPGVRRADPEG
ncbi:MAG: NnrS family protein [Limisphaerales bacterium]